MSEPTEVTRRTVLTAGAIAAAMAMLGPGSTDAAIVASRPNAKAAIVTGSSRGIGAATANAPYKRIDEPADIADVIVVLCSGDGAWVNGQTVFANGGTI